MTSAYLLPHTQSTATASNNLRVIRFSYVRYHHDTIYTPFRGFHDSFRPATRHSTHLDFLRRATHRHRFHGAYALRNFSDPVSSCIFPSATRFCKAQCLPIFLRASPRLQLARTRPGGVGEEHRVTGEWPYVPFERVFLGRILSATLSWLLYYVG